MSKKVKHVHKSAMALVEEQGNQEETMRKVLTRSKKSGREHKTLDLSAIVFDPADNYRWGDEKGMQEDINTGESAKTYARLRASIHDTGVEEPIGVFPDPEKAGMYRLIFGFTRAKAAIDSGIQKVDAYVYPADISAQERLLLQGRENSVELKRKVSWAKEVAFLERLASACGGMDSSAWAKAERILGKAKGTLSRMKRTWENIPECVKQAAEHDQIKFPAAECFYTKDGPRFNEKEAKLILEEASVERGKEVEATQSRIVRAIDKLSEADENGTSKISKKAAKSEGVKPARMSTKDLREHMIMLIASCIPEGGNTSMKEAEINDLEDTPEAYTCLGLGIAFGDVRSPYAEGQGQETYEELSLAYRHACILRAFASIYLEESDTMVKKSNKEGAEEVPWLDAKGVDPLDEESTVSNKKVLESLINVWANEKKIDVEEKGKTKKVEATIALKVNGFMSELDERIASMQE